MTTKHLMLVSIGPVQDFIAAARRTRDLWFGSHILSEIARGAARAAAVRGGLLIFPALEQGDLELEFCASPLRDETSAPPMNIANKLLLELPESVDPAHVAASMREATLEILREFAKPVWRRAHVQTLLRDDIQAAWDEQLDSLIEFNAVWLPLGSDYKETRDKLEAALAARKNVREFAPWTHDEGGLPKSSLDGARMSLFDGEAIKAARRDDLGDKERQRRILEALRVLRVTAGEELDAVGLVKRTGGEPDQFIPLVNLTYASWMERAKQNRPQEFASFFAAVETLYAQQGADEARRLHTRGLDWVDRFPYDAHLVSVDRRVALEKLWVPENADKAPFEDVMKAAQALVRRAGQPHPYVACLLADGDKMGDALDKLDAPDKHRKFSTHLARFAEEAREIVEQGLEEDGERYKFKGFLVYAGGDDVLAFVALEHAIECAEALKNCFMKVMREALPGVADKDLPTLSVGLGVGHMLESMGHLRQLAHVAEKLAKGDKLKDKEQRNALAIVLDKRSGNTIQWREQWDKGAASKIQLALGYLGDDTSLSSKKVYQVRALLDQLPSHDKTKLSENEFKEAASVLAAEVRRVLGRSNLDRGEALAPEAVGLMLDGKDLEALRHEIDQWVTRMLIARTIADAKGRAAYTSLVEVDNG